MNLISITTRCETIEAFLELFHRYIDPGDQALFIANPDPREVGTKAPFQIRLRDGSIVMRGEAEVVRRWAGDGLDSPWARPGYCIKLSSLESDSQEIYDDLIDGSRSVQPAARRMVPPVAAPTQSKPMPAEPEPEPEGRAETSFPIVLGDLVASAPPAVREDSQVNPLWGALPPPPPPRPKLVEVIRRSKRAQIATGIVGGVIVGTILALLTLGDKDTIFVVPDPSAAPIAGTTPAPPAAPAPAPVAAPDPAPAPPAEPEPEIEDPEPDKPRRRPVPSDGMVTLDLRSNPAGAIFFVDGKNVGKSPVKVKVKAGKRVKVSAQLKGYTEWKDRLRAKDDRRVTARLKR